MTTPATLDKTPAYPYFDLLWKAEKDSNGNRRRWISAIKHLRDEHESKGDLTGWAFFEGIAAALITTLD